jgi:Rha family phage regulatory protein
MPSIQGIELTVMNGKPTTTSRQIAINFHKRHDTVLRKIENLDCSKHFNRHNFVPVQYEDEKGESRKAYNITRDGFVYVAMGFTGKHAAQFKEAYIDAFNKMEERLKNLRQIQLGQAEPNLDYFLSIGQSLKTTRVEISHTKKGEIINVTELEQKPEYKISLQEPIIPAKLSWQLIVETFFDEIENGGIPEKMRQNILLSKEMTSTNKQHDCLFFRLSNLMVFFRKTPHFADLMHASTIRTASMLLKQLKGAGVLAFDGKEKEKSISMNPSLSSDTTVRRVSHLVAIDLVVLERDYGIVMPSNTKIARALH